MISEVYVYKKNYNENIHLDRRLYSDHKPHYSAAID